LLVDHLTAVGAGAARFAEAFGAAEHARIAGLWHDLCKYSAAFQAMICAANGKGQGAVLHVGSVRAAR
jgi:CRISPR-associated endonuclease/helicase Cas3